MAKLAADGLVEPLRVRFARRTKPHQLPGSERCGTRSGFRRRGIRLPARAWSLVIQRCLAQNDAVVPAPFARPKKKCLQALVLLALNHGFDWADRGSGHEHAAAITCSKPLPRQLRADVDWLCIAERSRPRTSGLLPLLERDGVSAIAKHKHGIRRLDA